MNRVHAVTVQVMDELDVVIARSMSARRADGGIILQDGVLQSVSGQSTRDDRGYEVASEKLDDA